MPNHLRADLVFRLSCWVLGLVAFGQLLTAGVALAVRVENAREVRIVEKVVPKIITIAEPAPPAVAVAPPTPKPVELPPLPQSTPLPPPSPLAAPAVADPEVERLIAEARKARMADDMGTAFLKLQAAGDIAPEDPNVIYETGLVYEEMAAASSGDLMLADQAAECYQKISAMGTTRAGTLYVQAMEKLRDGIAMPADLRGEMALGRVRIFKDEDHEEGQRVVVTVPVHAAPDTELEEGDLEVRVTFYDFMMKNGQREILQTAVGVKEENVRYVTLPFDFATGEELVRFTYILPEDDPQQEHLFGKRSYYGQVVELLYKGELIDTQAWPRHLSRSAGSARQGGNPFDQMPEFLTEDMIDHGAGLLPPMPGDFLPNPPADLPPGDLPPPPPDR
jgi:hypothetical protein